jgi:hypothetical protein
MRWTQSIRSWNQKTVRSVRIDVKLRVRDFPRERVTVRDRVDGVLATVGYQGRGFHAIELMSSRLVGRAPSRYLLPLGAG